MRKNIHKDRKQHWSCIHNDTILYFINRIFFSTYLAFFQHVISRAYLFHSRVNQDAHLLSGDINCTVWETRTQASLLRQLPIILEGGTGKSYGEKNFAILHFFVLWRWWCCLPFFFLPAPLPPQKPPWGFLLWMGKRLPLVAMVNLSLVTGSIEGSCVQALPG